MKKILFFYKKRKARTNKTKNKWKKSVKVLFFLSQITSSLCDAVGSEDEKQTRTLTNGKDRHHN